MDVSSRMDMKKMRTIETIRTTRTMKTMKTIETMRTMKKNNNRRLSNGLFTNLFDGLSDKRLFNDKRGIEMGMNTIVMAVIALAVLIVLLIVFSGRFGLFSGELNNCETTGRGDCIDKTACENYDGRIMDYRCSNDESTGSTSSSTVCCVTACSLAGGECTTKRCDAQYQLFADCGDNEGVVCCKKGKSKVVTIRSITAR
ncbi:hypothetical protein JXB31_02450 [Candidatus Woesearchaeota archaeon]|nr:hypothetical protein [Candidatus Woesearchaeota archaeon]